MDFNSLKDQVSNLTMYDLKAGVRKVQNAVMNYTEMEAKVREATNNEPWGASSTLMQEIASGTFNYHLLNEIMPMIYKRFTEKTSEEWRQIYKALQLLEFLIKNGSERVIDDARTHVSYLKMLRQFHYIDQNGKDQGLNVRNRAKELADLLSDVERIRSERKKSRATRNKYNGVEGGNVGLGGGSSAGSKYGGFGSEEASYGGYSGGVYGDGGGFSGNASSFSDTQGRKDRFEEYNEYDEGAVAAPGKRKHDIQSSASSSRAAHKEPEPPKSKAPEVDLFSFGDDDDLAAPSDTRNPRKATNNGLASLQHDDAEAGDDDDFDDFQSATPEPLTSSRAAIPGIPPPTGAFGALPSVQPSTQTANFASLLPSAGSLATNNSANINNKNAVSVPSTLSGFPTLQQQQKKTPTGYQSAQPNYFTSVPNAAPLAGNRSTPAFSSGAKAAGVSGAGASSVTSSSSVAKASGGDAFSSLLVGTAFKKTAAPTNKGLTMADMSKQKATEGLWGAAAAPAAGAQRPAAASSNGQSFGGNGLDDLLG